MPENITINNYRSRARGYFLGQSHPAALAFFRIAIGSLAIIHWAILFRYAPLLYGEYGIIKPEISRAIRQVMGNNMIRWDLVSWTEILAAVFHTTEQQGILVFLCVYGAFLLFLTTGFLTTFSALVCWFLNLVLLNSYQLTSYGYDMFMSNCLLLLVFMPTAARLSFDRLLFRRRSSETLAGFSFFTLRIFLCVIYFFSGINKMVSHQWWTGEAIWRACMQPPFHSFDLGFLARVPVLLTVGSIFTLLVETFYPLLIHIPATRRVILLMAIAMHLSIAMLLGLWFFSGIMIAMNLTLYLGSTHAPPHSVSHKEPTPPAYSHSAS
ncbi:MAG TPA: HTTM domain-containing protein [Puia sp.]|jgi:hypothetical protein